MIKENIKINRFNDIGLPRFKGHVKIRLHNPNTWKTQIFEGDNIITNALADIFAANLCGAVDYRKFLPMYAKMLGGVLLFQNQLDVSSANAAEDYFIPDEGVNPLTAHAGQTAFESQADDPKRGNPLDSAVHIADGAVTLAWEWGSAGGNGIIKSLALTHSDVGDAGTGSNSDAFKAMTPNINANSALAVSQAAWFVDADGYGYSFTFSGSSLTFTRFPTAYREVGLVGLPYDYVSGIQKTKTVTIGTTYGYYPYFAFDKETSKLYLFYNTSLSTTVYVDIIDFSDWDNIPTPTHAEWSLDEAVGGLSVGGNSPRPMVVPIANGYVYLPKGRDNASGFLKVHLSNTADQTSISGTFKGSTGVFIPNVANRVIAGKCFVINNNALYPTAIESPDVVASPTYQNVWQDTMMDQGKGLTQLSYLYTNSGYYYPSISKFYLATKYNNSTTVEKTTSQNMVVEYTLTEVEEES